MSMSTAIDRSAAKENKMKLGADRHRLRAAHGAADLISEKEQDVFYLK